MTKEEKLQEIADFIEKYNGQLPTLCAVLGSQVLDLSKDLKRAEETIKRQAEDLHLYRKVLHSDAPIRDWFDINS